MRVSPDLAGFIRSSEKSSFKKLMNTLLNHSLCLIVLNLAAFVGLAQGATSSADQASETARPSNTTGSKPSIVLVHGAFADGSSWNKVIPLLEGDGYAVTAVQNPLTSLADDVATTRRAVEAQQGPVVLVGHSYGGAVICGAAADNPEVKALVFIAAFAPDVGEAIGPLQEKFSPPALGAALVPDSAGFLFIDRSKFHGVFADDLPVAVTRVMAAAQKPIQSAAFAQSLSRVAWRTIPSWFLVAANDQAINPDLERYMAKRINATTSEVASSHVPFLSHPREVAAFIEQAAHNAER